jgi:hypothetical protein
MNVRIFRYAIGSMLVGATVSLSAHHTISTFYDPTRRVTLHGVVDTVEWKNPHSFIELGVAGDNGGVAPWIIETQAAYVLRQRHMDLQTAFAPGETVTVSVCIAKDGAPKGWLRTATTSAGITFDLSGAGGC